MLVEKLKNFSISTVTAVVAGIGLLWWFYRRQTNASGHYSRSIVKSTSHFKSNRRKVKANNLTVKKVHILYATQTGISKKFAIVLRKECADRGLDSELINVEDLECDPEEGLTDLVAADSVCVFLVSTYTDGSPPDGVGWFFTWLNETVTDFRVQKSLLSGLQYVVVGLGDSLYKENFCKVGTVLDEGLHMLSANRVLRAVQLDENVINSKHGGLEGDFDKWREQFWQMIDSGQVGIQAPPSTSSCQKSGGDCNCSSKPKAEQEAQFETSSEEEDKESDTEDKLGSGLVDLEDLGKVLGGIKKKKVPTATLR